VTTKKRNLPPTGRKPEKHVLGELAVMVGVFVELARILDEKLPAPDEWRHYCERSLELQRREVEALEKIAYELDHFPRPSYAR
jgi:hypothetical protein